MKLKNQILWDEYVVKSQDDAYNKCCIDVARKVMEILDEGKEFKPHDIICKADHEIGVASITGFMAGCVAQMVSECHERGEEFRKQWNKDNQIKDEGDRANNSGGVINPAVISIQA